MPYTHPGAPTTHIAGSFLLEISGAETIASPLLSDETITRHCLPRGTTRLCSACVEENQPYERLFWNLRSVLLCLRHLIFLIDRCPTCQRLIPSLRSKVLQCPSCHRGDYRIAERVAIPQHSILFQSQRLLQRMLGICEKCHVRQSSHLRSNKTTLSYLHWRGFF